MKATDEMTLQDYMQQLPIGIREFLCIASDLASQLEKLHMRGQLRHQFHPAAIAIQVSSGRLTLLPQQATAADEGRPALP